MHAVEELQENERRFTLSANDLALLNPNTHTCPIFRSKRDMELTKGIYTHIPILLKERPSVANPWDIKFSTLFHMANDSHLFRTREELELGGWTLKGNVYLKDGEKYFPLYEGKMISLFDHRFGSYEGTSLVDSELNESKKNNPSMLSIPRYWIHESQMPNLIRDGRTALLAFRDIARSTDVRTAIFRYYSRCPLRK